MPKRIFITVAEVSGDHHAAALARALRSIEPDVIVEGHGGSAMREAGVEVHRETVSRAGMLYSGAMRAVEVWRLLRWTRNYYTGHKPDLHICIDSSGMNLHFAKMARAMGVPVLYYIAPQLWASREGRIEKVRRYVDQVACILPFEEGWYAQRGVKAMFVGHPLFDQLPPGRRMAAAPRDLSEGKDPVVGLMPGSRRSEVRANWPHLLKVAAGIKARFPRARFEVPTTPPTDQVVRDLAATGSGGALDLRMEINAIDVMAPGWDFCIAKSGTSTLHVAAYAVPMIVVYRLSALTWHLIGKRIIKTPSIALVNILAARGGIAPGGEAGRIVPEIIPWNGPDQPVIDLALEFLADPAKRLRQQEDLKKLLETLDRAGASERTARLALKMAGGR